MADKDNEVTVGHPLNPLHLVRGGDGRAYHRGHPITREQLERLDGFVGLTLGFYLTDDDDDGPKAA